MDRKYIESEHIVDRYLAGELTVREAREFEKFCLEHPDFLSQMPIPVRLKARLARRPLEDSETGVFHAIPSSTSHAAVTAGEEGFDADEEQREWQRSSGGTGVPRALLSILLLALIGAVGGLVAYGLHARELSAQLRQLQRDAKAAQLQAPGSMQTYRVQLSRSKPQQATLAVGWPVPPQLLDIYVDATEAKYTTFQITIDKVDGGRIMQIHRIARDSNRDVRFKLNSSAFGRGDYLLKFDGYTWRGQPEEIGWIRLGLQ